MRLEGVPVFAISTAAALVGVVLVNWVQAPEDLALGPTAVAENHLPAVATADEGLHGWKSLYSIAPVVARVQVLRIVGDARGNVIAEVTPLEIFKSDGAPVRYLIHPLVYCAPTFIEGDSYLVFAERAPVPAANTLQVIRPANPRTLVHEDASVTAELIAQLEAWSGVRAGAPGQRFVRAETECSPLG